MKRLLLVSAALFTLAQPARAADEELRRVQQALRDQGFFYGQADGNNTDETSQAIRRFQIRNALPVTGRLDAATKQAITSGVDAARPPKSNAPTQAPAPAPINPDNPDAPRPSEVIGPVPNIKPSKPVKPPTARPAEPTPAPRGRYENAPAPTSPPAEFAPEPPAAARGSSPVFQGSAYADAPPFVQSSVLGRAQAALAREGFYGGAADGVAGPQTFQAVRDFQASTGLRMSGRLDNPTLNALGIAAPVYEGTAAPRVRPPAPRREGARYLGGGVYEGRIVPETAPR